MLWRLLAEDLNRVELWLLAAALLAALAASRWKAPRRLWPAPPHPVLVVFLAALLGRVALLPVHPVPVPFTHDEFSFLLQADTFAHGRLTNPTHPLWQHFESIHIFHQPTYQSMYPPAPGLILALGQLLGHPWIGVLLSAAAACAAICWMLLGWMPRSWAFWGGMLAVLRMGLASYWVNSYWGGAVAALGGALVLGAVARLARRYRARDSLLLGLGLALLANSRPFEGLLLALPVTVWLLWKAPWRRLIPAALVMMLAAAGMGYYFWRVTGSPWQMPYSVNRATYGWPASLPGLPLELKTYRHKAMLDYALWEQSSHSQYEFVAAFLGTQPQKLNNLWAFFLGPALTLPLLLCGRRLLRKRLLRLFLAAGGAALLGVLLCQVVGPHYLAPATAVFFALAVQAIRHLWRGRLWLLAPAIPAVVLLTLALSLVIRPGRHPHSWCCVSPGNVARAGILDDLKAQPGGALVIVRYRFDHNPHLEWVYNEADIDHAKVVWAREMSNEENRRLLDYFKDRRAVLLEADQQPPRMLPYEITPASQTPPPGEQTGRR